MNDLFSFIYAILSQWVVLMSGIIGLGITIWLRVRGKDISNKIFWAISVSALLLACFFAWRDEHISLKKIERELAQERDRNTPRLSGLIEGVKVGKSMGVEETQVLIHLSVRNTGVPSIAEGFELAIQSSDFEENQKPTDIPKGYTLLPLDKSPNVTLNPEDALPEKPEKPIEPGTLKRGWLRFVLMSKYPERLLRPGMRYTVSFSDILGKKYSAEYRIPEGVK